MDQPEYKPERRPIASREHVLSKKAASFLANAGVSPNAISTAGMIAGILGGISLAFTNQFAVASPFFLFGGLMMQTRLLANMFDGMVAIQTAKASPVGSLYNEIPDRISDAAFFVGAGYALGGIPELGYWAAIMAIMTAYVRSEGRGAGAHQEFCGPMAKPQRMAVATGACVIAAIIPEVWLPKLAAFPNASIMSLALLIIAIGSAITIVRRLLKIAAALQGLKK